MSHGRITYWSHSALAGAAGLALIAALAPAAAGELRPTGRLTHTGSLPANDDGSSGEVRMGFRPAFDGQRFNGVYVNNNGNLTFGSSLSQFTPDSLASTGARIIAPFWADVDTRASGNVTYGRTTIRGRQAFVATWRGVGYYSHGTDKKNTFQVVLIDRSDRKAGDFDIEFNYRSIQWESGDASGGRGGLGGNSARAGFAGHELEGSGVDGAFLDSNPNGLAHRGRLVFEVRDGELVVVEVPSGPSGGHVQSATIDDVADPHLRARIRSMTGAINNRIVALMQARAAGAGQLAAAVAGGGLSGGDSLSGLGVWVDGSISSMDHSSSTEAYSGQVNTTVFGLDYGITDRLFVGLAMALEGSEVRHQTNAAELDGKAVTGSLYAAWAIDDTFSLDAQVGIGRARTDILERLAGAQTTGDYSGTRVYGATHLLATTALTERIGLTGKLGYSYSAEFSEDYVASDGVAVSPDTARVGTVVAGLQLDYATDLGTPYLGATWEMDTTHTAGDSNGLFVEAGYRFPIAAAWTGGAYAGIEMLRGDTSNRIIGANLRYQF